MNCSASTDNVPQQVIYHVSGLKEGQHYLKVVNDTPNYWMLLDELIVQS